MIWKKAVEEMELAAAGVLSANSIPTTRQELMDWLPSSHQQFDTLTRLAIEIVFGVHYLREYAEKEYLHRSLDTLIAVTASFEEFDILRNVPEYKGKREPLTKTYFRDMARGVGRRKSGDKGRANRPIKATAEQARKEIDVVFADNPKWGITDIRTEAAARLGLARGPAHIGRITNYYNPKK